MIRWASFTLASSSPPSDFTLGWEEEEEVEEVESGPGHCDLSQGREIGWLVGRLAGGLFQVQGRGPACLF